MIGVEWLWGALILSFGVIGAVRGLAREVGVSAIVSLSLFALWLGWDQAGKLLVSLVQRGPFADLCPAKIKAIYYSCAILFVAFISYEGIVLIFPVKLKGFLKNVFGFIGGLFNGYLIIGTVWNVVAQAEYFRPQIKLVLGPTTELHNTIVQFLPVSLMESFSPIPMLILGMLLLLAIVIK